MPVPAVHIDGVTFRYGGGTTALHDLALSVAESEAFALLGPNGSGKTTLFRLLTTLVPPTRGTVRVYGHEVCEEPGAVRRLLGVAFQEPALDEALTVEENLRLHGALFGLRGPLLDARLTELLERFEIISRRADRVATLSGGLRRRADLARALLHRPRLLLLDEPTSGLDPAARHVFWRHLSQLNQQDGTTLLVATHLMEEAERADRVAILHEGRRVVCDTPQALKSTLGDRALWIESTDPDALQQRIQAQFGLQPQRVGALLQVEHEDAPALLARLYDAFGKRIESATVRRPTLEDVFMLHTRGLDETPFADAESFELS